jgi:hypothetical protein
MWGKVPDSQQNSVWYWAGEIVYYGVMMPFVIRALGLCIKCLLSFWPGVAVCYVGIFVSWG